MPRPRRATRPLYARRRHRTWVRAMILSCIAWGIWWVFFFVLRLNHDAIEALPWVRGGSFLVATAGLLVAVSSLRATRTWLLFVLFPILANASVFFVPWMVEEWMQALDR